MADVSVKMSVSGVAQFKSSMKESEAAVKTFDAAMKMNEKQLKATGNAENYMQAQTSLLNGKLKEQEKIAKNAEQALKQMEANGVKTTSKSYQDMQRKLIEAQSAMLDTQMEMDGLGAKAADATGKTDKLGDSLGGLNKKISLDQVISVVDKLSSGMENAAKKAIQLGQDLWDSIMDSARWADDTATMAQMYGIDLDTFQRMQKLVTNGLDTSVDAILNAQSKLNKNIGKGAKETMETMRELGLLFSSGKGEEQLVTNDSVELFWLAGQALMDMSDAFDKEAAAQSMFGRSWKELVPLFTEFKSLDEYKAALAEQNVVSEDAVNDLVALNDKVGELKGNFETLKSEVLGSLAPALTQAADTLSGLLARVLEYLKTPEGQQALDDLGKAVEGLFSDLSEIDPQQVVDGFSKVFNDIVSGIQWLYDNKDAVIAALEGIFGVWATLQVADGVLTIVKLINGIQGLTGAGAAAAAGEAGAAAGASWGTGFAGAVLKAAPWLLFLYETLKPNENTHDELGNSDLTDKNGNLTEEAKAYGYTEEYAEETKQINDRYEAIRKLTGLTDQQRNALQGFWSVWKDVEDMRGQGKEVPQHRMDAYNLYGQQLQTLFEGQETQLSMYMQKMQELYASGERGNMLDLTFFNIDKDGAQIMVSLQAPEDAAEQLEEQVGTAEINCVVHFVDENGNNIGVDFGDEKGEYIGGHGKRRKKANGIWSVPFDGYTAILHKGEQVVPARQVANNRTLNSNLYVESMYMNNGTDAEGLAAAMAAAQRRTLRGYGS